MNDDINLGEGENLNIDDVWWIKNIKKRRCNLEEVTSKKLSVEDKINDINAEIASKKMCLHSIRDELYKFDLWIKSAGFFAMLSLVISLLAAGIEGIAVWGVMMIIDSVTTIYPMVKFRKLKKEVMAIKDEILDDRVVLGTYEAKLSALNNSEAVIREGKVSLPKQMENKSIPGPIMYWECRDDDVFPFDDNTEVFLADQQAGDRRKLPTLVKKISQNNGN